MVDPLTHTLISRTTASPPPNTPNRVPPAWDRWLMAEMMKKAYLNNWTPNPILLKVLGERVHGKPERGPKQNGNFNGNTN